MIRKEQITGITITTVRFFLGSESESPYIEVFMDGDTEVINYVDPTRPTAGRILWPAYSTWDENSVRAALIAELTRQEHAIDSDASELIEAVLAELRWRQ